MRVENTYVHCNGNIICFCYVAVCMLEVSVIVFLLIADTYSFGKGDTSWQPTSILLSEVSSFITVIIISNIHQFYQLVWTFSSETEVTADFVLFLIRWRKWEVKLLHRYCLQMNLCVLGMLFSKYFFFYNYCPFIASWTTVSF
jgi:hypothetical protein